MRRKIILIVAALTVPILSNQLLTQVKQACNPIIFADVPDMAMVRVGDVYYMSSTTMHMSPGLPIMKSNDLVNWLQRKSEILNQKLVCFEESPTVGARNL